MLLAKRLSNMKVTGGKNFKSFLRKTKQLCHISASHFSHCIYKVLYFFQTTFRDYFNAHLLKRYQFHENLQGSDLRFFNLGLLLMIRLRRYITNIASLDRMVGDHRPRLLITYYIFLSLDLTTFSPMPLPSLLSVR